MSQEYEVVLVDRFLLALLYAIDNIKLQYLLDLFFDSRVVSNFEDELVNLFWLLFFCGLLPHLLQRGPIVLDRLRRDLLDQKVIKLGLARSLALFVNIVVAFFLQALQVLRR